MTLLRPALSVENPVLGTRLLYLPLRGMSRDRLDLLGEEYFNYVLSSRLRKEGIRHIEELHAMGKEDRIRERSIGSSHPTSGTPP